MEPKCLHLMPHDCSVLRLFRLIKTKLKHYIKKTIGIVWYWYLPVKSIYSYLILVVCQKTNQTVVVTSSYWWWLQCIISNKLTCVKVQWLIASHVTLYSTTSVGFCSQKKQQIISRNWNCFMSFHVSLQSYVVTCRSCNNKKQMIYCI